MKNIEVELKFPLINPEDLIKKLNSIAQQGKEDYQKDIYYIPPHRNFIQRKPISEWLRLRESKKGISLNYKKWHNEDGSKTVSCDEFETNVGNSALKEIFEKLNFKEIIAVEKTRNSWNYKNVSIAIDKVTNLGHFIELEARGNFNNIEEAKAHLFRILKELNADVGPQDFKGYPHLMLEKKGLL